MNSDNWQQSFITTTEADKQGTTSNHYAIKMRVGTTHPEQATKPTLRHPTITNANKPTATP